MAKEIITSEAGGARQQLNERWDMIPGGWQSLSEVAHISDYGEKKYARQHPDWPNWHDVDLETEQSPLNHGLAHGYKALEFPAGSEDRIRQLAKAAWNFLAQIWFEKQVVQVVDTEDVDATLAAMAAVEDDEEPVAAGGNSLADWLRKSGD